MTLKRRGLALLLASAATTVALAAGPSARDDAGVLLTLPAPAQRIVSLSPHAAELLFAAGAGKQLVGVSRYSDFPPQVRQLPLVGDSARLDLEAVLSLHPDLVVAWGSALPERTLRALQQLGLPVFRSEPRSLEMIASNVERLAELAGSAPAGHAAAQALRARIAALRRAHAGLPPLPVFVQIWASPLMTVNRDQVISDALLACGARNLFADQALQATTVDPEAVVAADPVAIISGIDPADPGSTRAEFSRWRALPHMRAVARQHLIGVPSDLLGRPGPRQVDAAEQLCRALDRVRADLPLAAPGTGVPP